MANGQLWEIDSQGNKKIISGMVTGELPKYTMAEYLALTDKPIDWICTDYDATSEYGIKATEVKYGNTNVKDMLDVKSVSISGGVTGLVITSAIRIGHLVIIDFYQASTLVPANTTWFTVESSARPSSEKYAINWLPSSSDGQGGYFWGTKSFTLGTDGKVTCGSDVFRGGVTFIYTI